MSDFAAYTESVCNALGPKASPRIKQALPILIKHLHAAIIEADLTVEEWLATSDLIIEAGKVSSEKRNEVILVQDVLGIESLVDMLAHKRAADQAQASGGSISDETSSGGLAGGASSSAILGPFYRAGVPVQPNDTTIVRQEEANADYTYLYGKVYDSNGKPLQGAEVDVWHDAPDGLYDAQDESKPEHHCRGRFRTDEQGRYSTICLKPTPYPIPYDHSAGKLLKLMDRHPYRPAHIHAMITATGHKTLVSQMFDRTSDYLEDDSVFAVKDDLVVDFMPIKDSPVSPPAEFASKLRYYLEYDFKLVADVGKPQANGISGH